MKETRVSMSSSLALVVAAVGGLCGCQLVADLDRFDVSETSAVEDPCSDGVRNGDETGVDCGGSCPACPVIDECADGSAGCDELATCEDLDDGFSCACPDGYDDVAGDGTTCSDVDECATDTHGCDAAAVCTNTAGSHTCACPAGYTDDNGDGTACTDIDECAASTDDCDSVATCGNTVGGFTCTCPSGYDDVLSDGTQCDEIDECTLGTHNCDAKATCSNTPLGSFTCTCFPSYTDNSAGQGTSCSPQPGTACANPFPVTVGDAFVTTETTAGASSELSAPADMCTTGVGALGDMAPDQVFSVTPAVTGIHSIGLYGLIQPLAVYVVTDCEDIASTCVGAVADQCAGCPDVLEVNLTQGTEYFIIVDGVAASNESTYTIEIVRPSSIAAAHQFDMVSELIHDIVANNAATPDIVADQFTTSGLGYIPTDAFASSLAGSGNGLPDDAFFAQTADHPDVQLHWNELDDGPNAKMLYDSGDNVSFDVPLKTYANVQLYVSGGGGGNNANVTLHFADGTTDVQAITAPDWFADPAPAGMFYLIDGMDRVVYDPGPMVYNFQEWNDPALFGVDIVPASAKPIRSITVTSTSNNKLFGFWGATGW